MGLLADIQKRKDALAEALGASPTAKAATVRKKKKRTHVNQFTADEIGAMSDAAFMKLRQD